MLNSRKDLEMGAEGNIACEVTFERYLRDHLISSPTQYKIYFLTLILLNIILTIVRPKTK